MIQLNLLPDIKREYLKARRTQSKVISISILTTLVVVGVTVVLALWTYGAQELYKGWLSTNIEKNQAKIEDTKDVEKYVTVQNQLANLDKLHDEKNDYSRLFGFLPILNPKAPNSVRFTSVDVKDETLTITVSGEAKDFTGLVTLRDMMVNAKLSYRQGTDVSVEPTEVKFFTDVKVEQQQLSKNSEGGSLVSFRISAVYAKEAFLSSSTGATLSIPKLETTPSKQDSPGVFADSTVSEDQGQGEN